MPRSVAARTRAVESVSEPASASSVTSVPLAAPMAKALRIVSGAPIPAIQRRLERVLVVGVDDGRDRTAIEPPVVRPQPLAARGGVRHGLDEDDDSHGRAVSLRCGDRSVGGAVQVGGRISAGR
jgi:hypothetical protein